MGTRLAAPGPARTPRTGLARARLGFFGPQRAFCPERLLRDTASENPTYQPPIRSPCGWARAGQVGAPEGSREGTFLMSVSAAGFGALSPLFLSFFSLNDPSRNVLVLFSFLLNSQGTAAKRFKVDGACLAATYKEVRPKRTASASKPVLLPTGKGVRVGGGAHRGWGSRQGRIGFSLLGPA